MKKRTVEESYSLSIFDLKKGRLLEKEAGDWWSRKSNGLTRLHVQVVVNRPVWPETLIVRPTLFDALGREHPFGRSEVRIVPTLCRFGNKRWWFICPGSRCGRRVAKLYLPPGEIQYRCRHCHELTYEARQQHRNGIYDNAGRFGRYRKKLDAACTTRQRMKWSFKLLEALDGFKAYERAYHQRAMERIARMRKAAGIKGQPDISSVKL